MGKLCYNSIKCIYGFLFEQYKYVTKNGYGCLVVMNMDYYEKTMGKMHEAKQIIEGLDDVKLGHTINGEKAINDLRSKYGV